MHLTQGLHRAMQQTPDLAATICGERVRSWSACGDRVARFAGALRQSGVRQGDRIGILAMNSDSYHEVLLAIPWADAVAVPINTRWSHSEIAYSISDSRARAVIVDDTFAPAVADLRQRCAGVMEIVVHWGEGPTPEHALDYEALIEAAEPVPDPRRGGEELAAIYYTGGTTGTPKGVMLSHTNLITSALGTAATGDLLTPGGRLLHAAPMFHLADGAAWVARTMLGGTHVIVPKFTPAGVAEAIARHQVTDALLVPTMIHLLVDDPHAAEYDLSSLRRLVYGASPISETLLERARKRLPTAEFTQLYGMTELSPATTMLSPAGHADQRLRRSAGRALPHAEVRIVDEQDREVPRGTVGEIVARGGHVMLGYWERPRETASAVRDGWMHTGDAGHMDDQGHVFVVDRLKDMIVSGGENVYSAEVENVLSQHPDVVACAVIGVPDAEWGERVHAVVVLAPGATAGAEGLREHCKAHIAGYKTPRSVEFATELPVSGAGKILKRELRATYLADTSRGVS